MIHLHRHSEFSLPDGTGTADRWAKQAKEIGHTALGLTDHGTLGGALHHVKACRENELYPIVGVEAYFKPDRTLMDNDHKKAYHLTLHAANLKGWHNLIQLTTEAFMSGYYHKPCTDLELLWEHREGVICSTACVNSYLDQRVLEGDEEGAQAHLEDLKTIFGDRLWIEIMPHDFDEQRYLNKELANIAADNSIGLITTVDAHYPYKEWAKTQDIRLMCASGQSKISREKAAEKNEEAFTSELGTLYLSSEEEVREMYSEYHPDLPQDIVDESIKNTDEFAKQTSMYVINKDNKLPKVAENPEESEALIREWCEEGLERIGKQDALEYRDRYEYEFEILKSKGVLDYFVLVGDMVRWARKQGIRVAPGRGSAAGCLISYLIGITGLDPIGYSLLFERFLNPERKGLPDIDIDFDSDRRDEVKDYLKQKYGEDHVVDIATYQTFGPRAAIQEVSKKFAIPQADWKKATEPIGPLDEDINKLAEGYDELAKFKKKYPEIWTHAERLEGQVRNIGTHAAGVVITDRPVTDYMPLIFNNGTDRKVVTGWSDASSFTIISDFGFLKIDFLGLTNLSKHKQAVRLIKERHDVDVDLDGMDIVHDPLAVDPKVMKNFAKGYTLGVFQFAGRGITQLLRHIKPENLHDIALANALYRPGPIKYAFKYGDKKAGKEPVSYWHESVKPIMEKTLGTLAFQEQVMQITQILGGFTGGEADDMRKAMGKLYRQGGKAAQEFMAQYKPKWDEGIREKGIDLKEGNQIWETILEFGNYAFNASHSYSYAVQAYWDMWLKTYYPQEFYSALLSYDVEDDKELAEKAVREARIFGVQIGPPDINRSERAFTLDEDKILYGLVAVKHVGGKHVASIVNNRPYEDFEQFARTLPGLSIKAKQFLVQSGSFDNIDSREYLLSRVPKHKKEEDWFVLEHVNHNVTNLKNPRPVPEERIQPSLNELKGYEREALGVVLTMPTAVVENEKWIEERIYTQDEVDAMEQGEKVQIGGEVTNITEIVTKNGKDRGKKMAFVDVIFKDNHWSCTIFADTYAKVKRDLETGAVMIGGKKDNRGSIIVNVLKPIEDLLDE